MKTPAINFLLKHLTLLKTTFQRFPLPIILTFIITALAFYLLELKEFPPPTILKIFFTLVLGVPLFTALTIFSEKSPKNNLLQVFAPFAGVIILVLYFYFTKNPSNNSIAEQQVILRFAILLATFVIAVMIAPGFTAKDAAKFWHYNFQILTRFAFSAFCTAILFFGLSAAIFSIENLLKIYTLSQDTYFKTWIALVSIFNTWFFLNGVPQNFTKIPTKKVLPKEISLFAKYILLPLTIVYGLILYIYLAKILITQNWPNGWVLMPILVFAGVGIVARFILEPLLNNKNAPAFAKIYQKKIFLLLLPTMPLALIAILQRIFAYGLTEARYFGLLASLWIVGISIYIVFKKNIRLQSIIFSLFLILILSLVGPWSAFSTSQFSQVKRLENMLIQNQILAQGKIQIRDVTKVSVQTQKEIISIIDYLYNNHGFQKIAPWFSQEFQNELFKRANISELVSLNLREKILNSMGLHYISPWENPVIVENGLIKDQNIHFQYFADSTSAHIYDAKNFDFGFAIQPLEASFRVNNATYFVQYDALIGKMKLQKNHDPALYFNLASLIENLQKDPVYQDPFNNIPASKMILDSENDQLKARLYLESIDGGINNDHVILFMIEGTIFIKEKQSNKNE